MIPALADGALGRKHRICAITYILGSVILEWTKKPNAIEWGERAIRLSPFDPCAFAGSLLAYTRAFQLGWRKQPRHSLIAI
jgi:hypothetical protein